jgi:hypothetical protein
MKRGLTLPSYTLADASRTVSAVTISFTIFIVPLEAQPGPEVGVYGYVAPRCWVAKPATPQPIADMPASRPRVICNQATPRLESNVRALNADGTLERVQPTNPAHKSGRAALEIVVSPQI